MEENKTLLSIEPFLWSKICTYLHPLDVVSLSSSCKTLWEFLDVEHAGAMEELRREYRFAKEYNVMRILGGRYGGISFPNL